MNPKAMIGRNKGIRGRLYLISALAPAFLCYGPQKAEAFEALKNIEALNNSHDIALSAWGPYSKKYAGISHIPKMSDGVRFDVTLVPGYYRSKSVVPNVLFESGYVPWDVDSRMTRFTYRYQLEWKDQVYVDVTYTIVDEATVLVEMRCVNQTALPQNLALNLMANVVSPSIYPTNQIATSGAASWINATQYKSLELTKKSPRYNLVYDGQLRGEVRGNEFIDGKAVAGGFGNEAGDSVSYDLKIDEAQRSGNVKLYYRMKKDAKVSFHVTGLADQTVDLVGTGKFETISVPYSLEKSAERSIKFASQGGAPVEINGLIVVPNGAPEAQITAAPAFNVQPKIKENRTAKTVQLKYDTIPNFYGMAWDGDSFEIREVRNDELDIYFRRMSQDHVSKVLNGNGQGAYSDIYIRPVVLQPRSETTRYGLLATGSAEAVTKRLGDLEAIKTQVLTQKKLAPVPTAILPEGRKYALSQQLLRATVLSDVVYPVYTQGDYIRHFTPGKNWDSLYTWDSGFISLGLREINTDLALQCLNAYTTPPGSQSAFIHHGSPVPTQMYAFQELWQKTQSPEMLAY
ncbi:glycoside hydrolase, partial [bacterium]